MDTTEFQIINDHYNHELLVHCYRFFGSTEDAEDALQETWLRAWRHREALKEPTALRAWLYKIATNVSLDLLARRKTRVLPDGANPAAGEHALPAEAASEYAWIEPLPDEYLDGLASDPEARYELRESVSLAFLTLLQALPGRQRVVFIMRDVLGWPARDTAELLDLSTAAVNSALQRARLTVARQRPGNRAAIPAHSNNAQTSALLERYLRAWEALDADGLAALLSEEALLTMPPSPSWYLGRVAIRDFFKAALFDAHLGARYHLLPARANGGPAFAVYQARAGSDFRLASLQTLAVFKDQIVRIDSFLAQGQPFLRRFRLPNSI
jgi:RNA polymerase sigma-70 factor (ECF subfamily)